MITGIYLENFKAFGAKGTHVPLAPITLIFGENSAGKSSIIQSILLMKQSLDSRLGNYLEPRGELVDLDTLQEMIHGHDSKKKISVGFDVYFDEIEDLIFPVFANGIKWVFGCSEKDKAAQLKNLILTYRMPNHKTIKHDVFDYNFIDYANFELKKRRNQLYLEDKLNVNRRYISAIYDLFKENKDELASILKEYTHNILDLYDDGECILKIEKDGRFLMSVEEDFGYDDHGFDNPRTTHVLSDSEKEGVLSQLKLIEEAIKFYSKPFSLEDFRNRLRTQYKHRLLIDPGSLIPKQVESVQARSGRYMLFDQLAEFHIIWRFFDTSDEEHWIKKFRDLDQTESGSKIRDVSKRIENEISNVLYVEEIRNNPKRDYRASSNTPDYIGSRGEHLAEFLYRNPGTIKKINQWFRKLDVGYTVFLENIGPRDKGMFEIRLKDERIKSSNNKKHSLNLADVGFGISQLLPIIGGVLASPKKIFTIQQPESQIHPRLQADLGNFFAECTKSPQQNQFIIETHSEHLILRLQKLIRQNKLKNHEVSVIHVGRGENGSTVTPLPLNEKGAFVNEWPGGFFPERRKELL
ncbi:AAA family ATPase [bacterium]|nr:AAA family ATPase [bacterium]